MFTLHWVCARHCLLIPLDGSVGASCTDVAESIISWRINEGRRGKKSENSPGSLVTQPTLAPLLIEDDCSLSLSVGSVCVFPADRRAYLQVLVTPGSGGRLKHRLLDRFREE